MQLHNSTMVRLLSINIDGYCNATNPPVLLFLYVKLPFTVKMYDDDYDKFQVLPPIKKGLLAKGSNLFGISEGLKMTRR